MARQRSVLPHRAAGQPRLGMALLHARSRWLPNRGRPIHSNGTRPLQKVRSLNLSTPHAARPIQIRWERARKLKPMETKLADQQTRNPESKSSTETATRPPLPPFTRETAIQKVRLAEDGWNSRDPEKVALAYTIDSRWRNRAEFPQGDRRSFSF